MKTGEIDYGIIAHTEEKITEVGLKHSSARLMQRGTLLMAIYGEGVTRAKVAILGINAATNQACLAFLPHERLNTTFLYWYFVNGYERLRRISNEGSQKNLSSNIMGAVDVPVPSTREQDRIVTALQEFDVKQSNERAHLAKLKSLKTALMQDLLTGKVRVTPLLQSAAEATA